MRTKVDYRTASRDNYKDFCKKNPDENISYKDWKFIIYKFNESLRDHALETGKKVRLPAGLGDIAVNKKKGKRTKVVDGKEILNLPIDWKKTKEKGKIIYHMNFHTEGYIFGWIWFRRSAILKYADLWHFKTTRVTARSLPEYLKADKENQYKYSQWGYK